MSDFDKMKNRYEWVFIEWTRDNVDIIENYFSDSYGAALEAGHGLHGQIALLWTYGSEAEGETDKAYAYVSGAALDDNEPGDFLTFDNGRKVPKKFINEYQKGKK